MSSFELIIIGGDNPSFVSSTRNKGVPPKNIHQTTSNRRFPIIISITQIIRKFNKASNMQKYIVGNTAIIAFF
jgi:hypothetical protein